MTQHFKDKEPDLLEFKDKESELLEFISVKAAISDVEGEEVSTIDWISDMEIGEILVEIIM